MLTYATSAPQCDVDDKMAKFLLAASMTVDTTGQLRTDIHDIKAVGVKPAAALESIFNSLSIPEKKNLSVEEPVQRKKPRTVLRGDRIIFASNNPIVLPDTILAHMKENKETIKRVAVDSRFKNYSQEERFFDIVKNLKKLETLSLIVCGKLELPEFAPQLASLYVQNSWLTLDNLEYIAIRSKATPSLKVYLEFGLLEKIEKIDEEGCTASYFKALRDDIEENKEKIQNILGQNFIVKAVSNDKFLCERPISF